MYRFKWVVERNNWKDIGPATTRRLYDFVDTFGMQVVTDVKANIVFHGLIDTGFMLSSVGYRRWESGKGITIIVGAHYAIFHEYGTVYVMRRPFVGPALEMNQQYWEYGLREILRDPLRND
jgi:hypothetical protein